MGLINVLKKIIVTTKDDDTLHISNNITPEIMRTFEGLGYRFSSPIISCGCDSIMLLDQYNQEKALRDVDKMNLFLIEAKNLVPSFPKLFIDVNKMRFDEDIVHGVVIKRYTFLMCSPYTQTGKMSKYPITLWFGSEDDSPNSFSGRLSYMQDGSIGKSDISIFSGKKNYIVTLGLVGATLSLKKIEYNRLDGSTVEVVYKN